MHDMSVTPDDILAIIAAALGTFACTAKTPRRTFRSISLSAPSLLPYAAAEQLEASLAS